MSGPPKKARCPPSSSIVISVVIIVMILTSSSMTTIATAQNVGFDNDDSTNASITLWIPPKMLAGEKYSGVVTVAEPEGYDRDVLIVSSNPGVIRVPERVTIKANMHQVLCCITD